VKGEPEGPSVYPLRLKPMGTITAIMLFVDFSDINATITTDEARKQIIGNSREWYSVESFGKN